MKKIDVKLSKEKQDIFRSLVEELIQDGYDIYLQDGQTAVSIYLPESMVSIVLKANGTWKRE